MHRKRHLAESWVWYLKTGVLPAGSFYNNVREIIADLFAGEKTITAFDEETKELIRSLFNDANRYVIRRIAGFDLAVKNTPCSCYFPV
jgi:hypothetical protein